MNTANRCGITRLFRYGIFLLLFLPISLLGQTSKPIFLYYANGLQENPSGAKKSLNAIYRALWSYWTEEELSDIQFLLARNNHNDSFRSILVEQLIAQGQLIDEAEEYSSIDYENNNPYSIDNIIGLVRNPLGQYYFILNDIFIAPLGSYIEENIGDLAKNVASVQEDIKADKCVIIVAHSEGIHQANIIHDKLSSSLKDPNQLQIIGAGIPAYRVAGGGSYVTLEEDEFIKQLSEIELLGGSGFQEILPPNESNGPRYPDITGHQFLTYLYGNMSGPVLINHINQALQVAKDTCNDNEPDTSTINGKEVLDFYCSRESNAGSRQICKAPDIDLTNSKEIVIDPPYRGTGQSSLPLEMRSDVELIPENNNSFLESVIEFQLVQCDTPEPLYKHGQNALKCLLSIPSHSFSPELHDYVNGEEFSQNSAITNEVRFECLASENRQECLRIDDPKADEKEQRVFNSTVRQPSGISFVIDPPADIGGGYMSPPKRNYKKLLTGATFSCPEWHLGSNGVYWNLDTSKTYTMTWDINVHAYQAPEFYGLHSFETDFWEIDPMATTKETLRISYECSYEASQ